MLWPWEWGQKWTCNLYNLSKTIFSPEYAKKAVHKPGFISLVFLLVTSSDKPIILVLMHHTRSVEYSTGSSNWAEKYPKIKLQVDVLFHETQGGLLQCDTNKQAVKKIQKELQRKSGWILSAFLFFSSLGLVLIFLSVLLVWGLHRR